MKTKFLVLAALLFAGLNSFAQKKEKKEKDKILVGKTYTVDVSETGSKKPAKPATDEISFKGGKLNSKYMSTGEHHFAAGEYTIVSVDSAEKYVEITFSSESKDMEGQTIKWDGNVTDEAIEGKAVVTSKKGKVVGEYGFSGTEKEKKGVKKK